jgi:hypothetical protein
MNEVYRLPINYLHDGVEHGLLVTAHNAIEALLYGRRLVTAIGGVITSYGIIEGRDYPPEASVFSILGKGWSRTVFERSE